MSTYDILVSLSLVTLGAVVGIGVWQFVSVRRSQGRRGEVPDPGPHGPTR